MGGISMTQIAIIVLIVILIFGTGKLRNLGKDLGGALKDFKKSISSDDQENVKDADFEKVAEAKKESTVTDTQKAKDKEQA